MPIVEHADVRRMLLAQKAYVGGRRSRWSCTARRLRRRAADGADAEDARRARGCCSTCSRPIAKSWPSQWCLAANDLAIQVHGGYGYTREYDVEQLYRDNRLNPIHEGTHGIQALDLLGRKVVMDGGAGLRLLLGDDGAPPSDRADAVGGEAGELAAALRPAVDAGGRRDASTLWAGGDAEAALANASVYLEAVGHVVVAWIWLEQVLAAGDREGALLRRQAPGRPLLLPVRAAHDRRRSSTCSRASTAPRSRCATSGSLRRETDPAPVVREENGTDRPPDDGRGAAMTYEGLGEWLRTATLQEKCALLAGRDFWSMRGIDDLGIPAIVLTDGPHGVRLQTSGAESLDAGTNEPATCFPTAAALASSWDPALLERVGVALGVESRALGVSVLLGPGANVKRTPLCGRNFEYFSEDPLVSSAMAGAWIRGLQSEGVGASLKHFAVNNQETLRFSVDAVVDERALREIYLASFERAVVDTKPMTMMAAYNRVGGEYATESTFLLQQVLRDEWGFDGVVMSDWGATNDRVAGLRAGLDLQMPGQGDAAEPLVAAVREGRLDVAVVDGAVRRLVDLVRRTEGARVPAEVDTEAHQRLAEEAAAAGSVLLLNDGTLPLTPGGTVAVIGDFAAAPRFQGAGSSIVNARRVVAALDGIRERATVDFARGYGRYAEQTEPALLDEAVRLARGADVAVVFVGLPEVFETEGADRTHLRLPAAHDALVEAVAAANPRTVVVLSNGAPVEMPWVRRVAAVLEGYLGGQESGGAVARMLFGELEPGGRLAETFPARWTDHPVHDLPMGPRFSEYRESLFVGYRWFDTVEADVAFPFGFGLGYTSFAWSGAALDRATAGADDEVRVRVTVANTGGRAAPTSSRCTCGRSRRRCSGPPTSSRGSRRCTSVRARAASSSWRSGAARSRPGGPGRAGSSTRGSTRCRSRRRRATCAPRCA